MGSILCEHCAAACCRYLAIEIDTPASKRDYDDIRWYLLHEGISVFVEDGDWYLQIQTRCKHLGADNLCQLYESRPQICRDYQPNNCDYTCADHDYDYLFTHAKQLEEHYFIKTGRRLGASKPPTKSPKTSKKTKRETNPQRPV